jgi:hypothetical protein
MSVTKNDDVPWLLLAFSLPAKRASQRVEVWRKLQRSGAVALDNSGYLLPNNASNQERFEWLAQAIRKYAGRASVVRVQSIDNLSSAQLIARFRDARDADYQQLIRDIHKSSGNTRRLHTSSRISRLRSRFHDIVEIDFFPGPLQKRVETLLARADVQPLQPLAKPARVNPRRYVGRTWVTRPRPGIDRSASAWLIRRFIDKKARFIFAAKENVPEDSVPFDMFQRGFGHRGPDCTFETLRKNFRLRDSAVVAIGEMVHDADVGDARFGRKEAFGIDAVLIGWARAGASDTELLERGMQMIEGLYRFAN